MVSAAIAKPKRPCRRQQGLFQTAELSSAITPFMSNRSLHSRATGPSIRYARRLKCRYGPLSSSHLSNFQPTFVSILHIAHFSGKLILNYNFYAILQKICGK
jgi:hypothetical protein